MKILLVSRDVPDFQVFVDAVNADTRAIVYSPSMTQAQLMESISVTSVERLAVVSRKEDLFLGHKSIPESADLFQSLIHTFGIKTIDFLACNTLLDPRWTQFFTLLETSVVVGASNDRTGNLKYGGDWTMESTGQDIEFVYFSHSIQYYKYLLDLSFFSLFLKIDGTLMGVGNNVLRQLGIPGSPVDTFTPIPGVSNVKQIACGGNHTMLILADGTLMGAGYNGYRQLGIPVDQVPGHQVDTFTTIPGVSNVKQIACGQFYTMLLLADGTLMGAGNNEYRQLGIPGSEVDTFTSIPGVSNVKQIACGGNHTMILLADGTLMGAGNNNERQLGIPGSQVDTFTPIPGVSNVKQIACGGNHTMLILADGTLMGAGYNGYRPLGIPGSQVDTFTTIPGVSTVKQIACGLYHTMLLLADGTLMGAGYNPYRQLGIPGSQVDTFTTIPGVSTVKQIACGYIHTMILLEDGTLMGAGNNNDRQLGIDSTTINNISNVDTFTTIATDVFFIQGQPYINVPISNICFLANTPIVTNQGIFSIHQLQPEVHTLHSKKIVAITKTITQEDYLVCLEKDALGPNLPCQETILTQNHKLLYHGVMTSANDLLHLEKVRTVNYHGEVLYNVLMETHDLMMVNNLVCETLDPENGIAKLEKTLKEATYEEKELFIKLYNDYVLQQNTFTPRVC